jgi:hypothetical protein
MHPLLDRLVRISCRPPHRPVRMWFRQIGRTRYLGLEIARGRRRVPRLDELGPH